MTPRWLAGHLLVTMLVLLFVSLGMWQLRRLDERVARNENIELRTMLPPASVAGLVSGAASLEDLEYRSAFEVGVFDAANEILLRSRTREGRAGWHVLTPLVLGDGRALLVDRGWVPYEMDEPPIEEARPPGGEVRVEGWLRQEQDPPTGGLAALAPRDPAEGRLRAAYYVDVERLVQQMPYELLPVYLEMSELEPGQAGVFPLPVELPELSSGSHMGYALQWFSFAVIGVVGYALLLRRTVRENRLPRSG